MAVGLLLVAETLVNAASLVRVTTWAAGGSPSSGEELAVDWALDLGITDADAVVVGTALLLLVATVNVALAALRIGDSSSWSRSVHAFFLARDAETIAVLAGATTVALALTRLADSVGTGLLLLLIALVTIIAGRAMGGPSGHAEVILRLDALRESVSVRRRALERALRPFEHRGRVETTEFRSANALGFRFAATLVVGNLLSAVLVALLLLSGSPVGWETASLTDWTLVILLVVLPLFALYLLISTIAVVTLVGAEYSRAHEWRRRSRFLAWTYVVVVAAHLVLSASVLATTPERAESVVSSALIALPPVIVPPVIRAVGRRVRWLPGRTLAIIVPAVIRVQIREDEERVSRAEAELQQEALNGSGPA